MDLWSLHLRFSWLLWGDLSILCVSLFIKCYSVLASTVPCPLPPPPLFPVWGDCLWLCPGKCRWHQPVNPLPKFQIPFTKTNPGCWCFWVCVTCQADATLPLWRASKGFGLIFSPFSSCSLQYHLRNSLFIQFFFGAITGCVFLTQWVCRAVGGSATENLYFLNFLSGSVLNCSVAFQRGVCS